MTIHSINEKIHLESGGRQRKYRIFVPASTEHVVSWPLLFMLHGEGGTADHAVKGYGWVEKATKESFIVVFPEATPLDPDKRPNFVANPTAWNDLEGGTRTVDDIAFLRAVIDDVSRKFPIDPKRIYFTGFSRGATMSFTIGVVLSEIVAAIAAVTGYLRVDNPKPARPMSLLLITGSADPVNPLNGGMGKKNPWHSAEVKRPPLKQAAEVWAQLIGADPNNPSIEEQGGVKTFHYGPGTTGKEVIYKIVEGQGHEWPGVPRAVPEELTGKTVMSFNANDVIWDFLKDQRL